MPFAHTALSEVAAFGIPHGLCSSARTLVFEEFRHTPRTTPCLPWLLLNSSPEAAAKPFRSEGSTSGGGIIAKPIPNTAPSPQHWAPLFYIRPPPPLLQHMACPHKLRGSSTSPFPERLCMVTLQWPGACGQTHHRNSCATGFWLTSRPRVAFALNHCTISFHPIHIPSYTNFFLSCLSLPSSSLCNSKVRLYHREVNYSIRKHTLQTFWPQLRDVSAQWGCELTS